MDTEVGRDLLDRHTGLSISRDAHNVVTELAELVDEIRCRMAERRLPEVRARIADGGVVPFGAFAVSERGVTQGPRVVAWDEIAEIDAEEGEVVVRDARGERLAAAPLSEVPNAFLLAEMTQERKGK